MKKLVLITLVIIAFTGCATRLDVEAPRDTFLSMGDYVPGVETLGVNQEYRRAWTPFFFLYDVSSVRESLYNDLLSRARRMDANGITNVTFYSKPSTWSVLGPFTIGIGIWVDYYAEAIVVRERSVGMVPSEADGATAACKMSLSSKRPLNPTRHHSTVYGEADVQSSEIVYGSNAR